MAKVETLIERNRQFPDGGAFAPDLPLAPPSRTMVLTCADARVDPAHVLGLEYGEVAVLRNVGGRVTPAALQNLAMLAGVAAQEGVSGGWELVVMHHTDCGITRLAEFPDLLGDYFGIPQEELAAKSVLEPRAAVQADVAELRANPLLPAGLTVSGLVYDVATGRVETAVEPGPLRVE